MLTRSLYLKYYTGSLVETSEVVALCVWCNWWLVCLDAEEEENLDVPVELLVFCEPVGTVLPDILMNNS